VRLAVAAQRVLSCDPRGIRRVVLPASCHADFCGAIALEGQFDSLHAVRHGYEILQHHRSGRPSRCAQAHEPL
jgi:hypothetical protein